MQAGRESNARRSEFVQETSNRLCGKQAQKSSVPSRPTALRSPVTCVHQTTANPKIRNDGSLEDPVTQADSRCSMQSVLCWRVCVGTPAFSDHADRRQAGKAPDGDAASGRTPSFIRDHRIGYINWATLKRITEVSREIPVRCRNTAEVGCNPDTLEAPHLYYAEQPEVTIHPGASSAL
jgi:hypothetical protein